MSRPEHTPCVNTPEGIHRINELQRYYDEDPERYEAEERLREEQMQYEAACMAELEELTKKKEY